ncbi:hypothetical protein ABL78_5904 [Leptomonas seymouri]|uniref:Uncharacterized protein n=1 Tax=Leptomonas seymouri TaxID=5684 RepID=A0A0N1IJD5_LEPSE|nr:hypothetical protein ABL78_5904 [Leptomonas seymouri]|eukprot:KPI85042.1 hypothetical protein ABL78_5904 [Leptomonas seymouri]
MAYAHTGPYNDRVAGPVTSNSSSNVSVTLFDDLGHSSAGPSGSALHDAQQNRHHSNNNGHVYQLPWVPRPESGEGKAVPVRLPVSTEDVRTQLADTIVSRGGEGSAPETSTAAGPRSYHILHDCRSPCNPPITLSEDGAYALDVYDLLQMNGLDYAGTPNSPTASPPIATPPHVDVEQPKGSCVRHRASSISKCNSNPQGERTASSKNNGVEPTAGSPTRARVLPHPPFMPRLPASTILPTPTQYTNGWGFSASWKGSPPVSQLYVATATSAPAGMPRKEACKNGVASAAHQGGAVRVPRFGWLETSVPPGGGAVHAVGVPETFHSAKAPVVQIECSDDEHHGNGVTGTPDPAGFHVPTPPVKKALHGAVPSAQKPEASVKSTKHHPASCKKQEAVGVRTPPSASITASLLIPGMSSSVHLTSHELQPQSTMAESELLKPNCMIEGSGPGAALSPFSQPVPRQQQQQSVAPTCNNHTSHRRDTNISLMLNSPMMPATAVAHDAPLLKSSIGLRNPSPSAAAGKDSSAQPRHMSNELNIAPVANRRDVGDHVGVLRPPPAKCPADQPVGAQSLSSERSSLPRSGSDVEFDMWEYLDAEELVGMYANNSSDSTDKTYAVANEEVQKTAGARPVPSGPASIDWAASTSQRRSVTAEATNYAVPAYYVVSNPGSAPRSPQARPLSRSLGFHGDYNSDATIPGSKVQSISTPAPSPLKNPLGNRVGNSHKESTPSSNVDPGMPNMEGAHSGGSYADLFDGFAWPEESNTWKSASEPAEEQNPAASKHAARASKEDAGKGTPKNSIWPKDGDSRNTQHATASEAAVKAGVAPAAGESAPVIASVAQTSIRRPQGRFTSFEERRPAQRNCFDSFFVFKESRTSQGADGEEGLEVAVERADSIPLSASLPPFTSLFRTARAVADTLPSRNAKGNVSWFATAPFSSTDTKSITAPPLRSVATAMVNDVPIVESPLCQPHRFSLPPPPIADNGEGSDDDSALYSGFEYSSQLRLPLLIAPLSPQNERMINNSSKSNGETGGAAAVSVVVPRTSARRARIQRGPAGSTPHSKNKSMSPAQASLSPLANTSRSMSTAVQQYGSSYWLRGDADENVDREGSTVAPQQDTRHAAKRDDEVQVSSPTHATAQKRSRGARAAETSKIDTDRHSDDTSSDNKGVYSSSDSSSDEDEVLTTDDNGDDDDDGDDDDNDDVNSDGSSAHEEEREDDESQEGQREGQQQEEEQEGAQSRCVRAAATNPETPQEFHTRAALKSNATDSIARTCPAPGVVQKSNELLECVHRDDAGSLRMPKAHPPYRHNARLNCGSPPLNGPRRFPPTRLPMRVNNADRLPFRQPHGMQQRLDNTLSLLSGSMPSTAFSNGRRGVNGFAVPQPVHDMRPHFHNCDGHLHSELPSLDTLPGCGLLDGLAAFQLPTPPVAQRRVTGFSLEKPGLHTHAVSESQKAVMDTVEMHPHARVSSPSGIPCDRASMAAFNEAPSISYTQEWVQPLDPADSVLQPPPSPSRVSTFEELEKAHRQISAKWFKFVAHEIRWVPSPGLPPDERGLEEADGADGASQEHETVYCCSPANVY